MELVFILAISLLEMFRLHFFKVVEIVRAFRVYTLMQDKKFSVLFGNESVPAVRAAQFQGRETIFLLRKPCVTDLAEDLPFGTVILVKIGLWSLAAGTGTVIGDAAFRTPVDGRDLLLVPFFKVRDEFLISPVLAEICDQRRFINLELLVIRRMGVIKRPLLKRDVSADKI